MIDYHHLYVKYTDVPSSGWKQKYDVQTNVQWVFCITWQVPSRISPANNLTNHELSDNEEDKEENGDIEMTE